MMWLLFEFYLSTDIDNIKLPEQKNNRPLQVELENGRSRLQNDFQIWEAR